MQEELFTGAPAKSKGIGGHTDPYAGRSDEWLTPPGILRALGEFDLDPCAAVTQPWTTAKVQYTIHDNGLQKEWEGRVWCNPPYGPETAKWIKRLAAHGNGVTLIFARTETEIWHQEIWPKADAILFLRGRLHFHLPDGTRARHNSGGPSAIVAYGLDNADGLTTCGIPGVLVRLRHV